MFLREGEIGLAVRGDALVCLFFCFVLYCRGSLFSVDMGDYNVVLLLIVIVVTLMVLAFNLYLLINYQHPDDKNQAWFPKVVVIVGLSVAELSILMLPADIANRHACKHSVYTDACNYTLPMRELWYSVYIVDAVLVFFVVPFSIFYYEADQEK